MFDITLKFIGYEIKTEEDPSNEGSSSKIILNKLLKFKN